MLRKDASSVTFWGPRVVLFAEGGAGGGACWAAQRHGASPATRSIRMSASMITSDRGGDCSRFFSPSSFASGFVMVAAIKRRAGAKRGAHHFDRMNVGYWNYARVDVTCCCRFGKELIPHL